MLSYQNGATFIEETNLADVVAQYGTPLYVYSAAQIRANCQAFKNAFASLSPHLHYSVKANGNLSILRLLHQAGISFDIVSGGELARLQAAGIPVTGVGFAGVGKTVFEIQQALSAKIGLFNVESSAELERIAACAQQLQNPAQVLLRLNPNVNPKTHKYITTGQAINKFGLNFQTAHELCQTYASHPWVSVVGFHMHIGSQIQQIEPYLSAARKILAFIHKQRMAGQTVKWLNLGGGFGVDYKNKGELSLPALAQALQPLLANEDLQLILEPGRSLIASAGALLMEVQYLKQAGDKTFVIVNAGMHTLIRPALYNGWHKIWPINQPPSAPARLTCDVVGPICESADFLAQNRLLPPVNAGDILALAHAGAYGMVMASNYNAHPRPAEVLIDGSSIRLIRRRETYADLLALEENL